MRIFITSVYKRLLVKTKKSDYFRRSIFDNFRNDEKEKEKDVVKIIFLLIIISSIKFLQFPPRFRVLCFTRSSRKRLSLMSTVPYNPLWQNVCSTEHKSSWQSHFRLFTIRVASQDSSICSSRWYFLVVFRRSYRWMEKKGEECIRVTFNERAFVP